MLELLLAFISNLKNVFLTISVLGVILSSALIVVVAVEEFDNGQMNEKTLLRIKIFLKKSIIFTILFGLLSSIPTVDQLWKVRIGLIKYNLASKENIEKSVQAIERIGKKLELKYLDKSVKKDEE